MFKDPVKQREAQLSWAKANPEKMNAAKKRLRMRNAAYVAEIKGTTPCMDCGVQYPSYVMDFDHRGDKKCDVNVLVNRAVRLELLQAEIDKCDVVCSNCHRWRTWERHPTKYS